MTNTKSIFKWLITLLIPLAIYAIPDYEGTDLAPKAPLFFAFTAWAVTAWIMETLPTTVVA